MAFALPSNELRLLHELLLSSQVADPISGKPNVEAIHKVRALQLLSCVALNEPETTLLLHRT